MPAAFSRQRNWLDFTPPNWPNFPPPLTERTVNALWDRIGTLTDAFSPRECANYFTACGYEPD